MQSWVIRGAFVVGVTIWSGLPALAALPEPTFAASFDLWPIADTARGERMPRRRVGAPGLAPGKVGRGLRVDGASYLEFPTAGNVNGQACTITLWVKLDAWGSRTHDNILGLSDSDRNGLHLERRHPDGRLRIVMGGPESTDGAKTRSLYSKQPLENGRWYHVAVGWDAARHTAALYLDGRLQARDDGPGPFPTKPPSLLVGAGFGRLARAVTGVIDELRIYGQCLRPEEVVNVMNRKSSQPDQTVVTGQRVLASVCPSDGTVTAGEQADVGGRWVFGPLRPSVQVDGQTLAALSWGDVGATEDVDTPLGPAQQRTWTTVPRTSGQPEGPSPIRLRLRLQAFKQHPVVAMRLEVTNTGRKAVRIGQIALLPPGAGGNVCLSLPAGGGRIFTDSGGLTGSGVHDLSAAEARCHRASGAMVVADEFNDVAVGFSAISFEQTYPRISLHTHAGGGASRMEVECNYSGGWRVDPGATAASEWLALHLPPANHRPGLAGHAALEHWADLVMGANGLEPPRHCPCGYNSWYAYRLVISEDLVLANARIMQKRFAPLGCTNFQIDHGWQYKDVCGHWVPNDRFSHGFPWLADELKKMGLTFGLWMAVSNVSEFAPFCKEHPEALAKDAKGHPLVTDSYWYWEPHGKCYLVDPTHPKGEAFYEQAGRLAREHGAWYVKNDFQGNLLRGDLVLHDPDVVRGVPVWRKAMAAFRRGMGDQMAYHACNAPLNAVAGGCDVAWVHVDLGNPRGAWDALGRWTDNFATRYHASGKFYWSDPDYLQVGQGDLAETRWRVAMVGLGGGPTYLCDRLPDLPEERLAMIPLVLPGYRKIARPIDLFDHSGYARQWHLPIATDWGTWHVVGLFNLDERATRLPVRLERLGLDASRPHLVMDFFDGKPLGGLQVPRGLGTSLDVHLEPHQTRLLRLTPLAEHPSIVGTDMHVTQGGVELAGVTWDEASLTLRGRAVRAPGIQGRVFVHVPRGYEPGDKLDPVEPADARVLALPLRFETTEMEFAIRFRRP